MFKKFLLFLGVIFLIRLGLALGLNLIPDEAYYWSWSRDLSCCYYDQPGMIAFIIYLTSWLPGASTPLTVRLPIILLSLGGTVLVYLISLGLFGSQVRAVAAAVLLNLIPLFFAGGILVMHDAPLIFFWLMGALMLVRLVKTDRPVYLYLTAAALVGAMYSKFTGVFLGVGVIAFFMLSPRARRWLGSPHFWLAALGALVLFAPVIKWNYINDWISFKAVLKLTHRGPVPLAKHLDYFFSYHGAQLALISPLIYPVVVYSLVNGVRRWLQTKDEATLICLALSLPALVYFSYLSLKTRVQPNWPAFGYPLALVLMVEDVGRRFSLSERRLIFRPTYWRWASGLALAMCVLLMVHASVCLIPAAGASLLPKDRLVKELRGWPELGKTVGKLRQPGQVIMALRYQVAAELEFYTPGQPRVYCLNAFGRGNHYDFVNDYKALGGKDVLLVSERSIPAELAEKFHEVQSPIKFDYSFRGATVKSFLIYNCRGFDHTRGRCLAHRKHI